jgi:hypothetical protein
VSDPEVIDQITMRDVQNNPSEISSQQHDLEARLADLAHQRPEELRWQYSVIDLLKLLDLYWNTSVRRWLADILQVRAGPVGSTKQKNALRKAIMEDLAAVELAWKDVINSRFRSGRCLNCGGINHWEDNCRKDCGKCTTTAFAYSSSDQLKMGFPGLLRSHKVSDCGHPVCCIECKFVIYGTEIH